MQPLTEKWNLTSLFLISVTVNEFGPHTIWVSVITYLDISLLACVLCGRSFEQLFMCYIYVLI